jgi:hypothetical protein
MKQALRIAAAECRTDADVLDAAGVHGADLASLAVGIGVTMCQARAGHRAINAEPDGVGGAGTDAAAAWTTRSTGTAYLAGAGQVRACPVRAFAGIALVHRGEHSDMVQVFANFSANKQLTTTPQSLQFFGSLWMSTQVPPHSFLPGSQIGVQDPSLQVVPAPHFNR